MTLYFLRRRPSALVLRLAVLTGLPLAAAPAAVAQRKPLKAAPPKIYTVVAQMPELPGGSGTQAIVQAIQSRVSYPPRALQAQIEGRVFVEFAVTATGRVARIRVMKGLVPACDSAVVQAVQRLPRFRPGRVEGKPVWVQFTLPVTFRIEE